MATTTLKEVFNIDKDSEMKTGGYLFILKNDKTNTELSDVIDKIVDSDQFTIREKCFMVNYVLEESRMD